MASVVFGCRNVHSDYVKEVVSDYLSQMLSKMQQYKYDHLFLCRDNKDALDNLLSTSVRFQLVYIDPPYNTGRLRGARKNYGDTDHRRWRDSVVQVASKSYQLLSDTGFLAASINQMELFNLKGLLDEVFGSDCFVGIFPVKIRHKDRQLMINATFHDLFEYLLIYRKKRTSRFFTPHKTARQDKFIYSIQVPDSPNKEAIINGKRIEIYLPHQYRIIKSEFTPESLRRYVIAGKLATGNWSGEWYENHLRHLGNDLLVRVWGLENNGLGYRWFQTGNASRRSGVYFQSSINAGRPILPTNDLDYTEIVPTTYRDGGSGCDFKDSKKPEALLAFLLETCTQVGDLVLDPYGGSGTTLAVAEKMGRSAVLIENNPFAISVIQNRINNLKTGQDLDAIKHTFSVGTKTSDVMLLGKDPITSTCAEKQVLCSPPDSKKRGVAFRHQHPFPLEVK